MSEEKKMLDHLCNAVIDYFEARDLEEDIREGIAEGDDDALDEAAEATVNTRTVLEKVLDEATKLLEK